MSITADVGHGFRQFLNSPYNLYIGMKQWAGYPYRYMWKCTDGTVLWWGTDNKKIKPVRVEFNPNKCDKEKLCKLLGCIKYPHMTRCDVTFDYHEKLDRYTVIDEKSRKSHDIRGRSGAIETRYVGSMSSALVVRIYNKKVQLAEEEKRTVDGVWWRVEAEIKSRVLDLTYDRNGRLSDPFEGITVKQMDLQSIEDVRQRAMAYYLLNEPGSLSELSHATRWKYKKLLAGLAGGKELGLSACFKKYAGDLLEIVNCYMDVARSHDVILNG